MIDYALVKGANHFYTGKMDQMVKAVGDYVDETMSPEGAKPKKKAAKKKK